VGQSLTDTDTHIVRLEKPKLDDHTNEITSMTPVVSFVQQIKAVENTVFYGFFCLYKHIRKTTMISTPYRYKPFFKYLQKNYVNSLFSGF